MRYRNNIRTLQNARGWTIDQAAEAMWMSRGGYLKIQRGENRLTSTTIGLAAKAFGVPESEIVGNSRPVPAEVSKEATAGEPPQGKAGAAQEAEALIEYATIVANDGTATLPPELGEVWGLKAGDRLEFFQDYLGGWRVRPRNASPLDFLKHLPPKPKRADVASDDDALTKALAERNAPLAAAKARE
jgi:transcriptional regulator with XRE-family HTH domain